MHDILREAVGPVNPISGEPRVLLRRPQNLKFRELATGQLQEFVEPVKNQLVYLSSVTFFFILHKAYGAKRNL